MYLGSLVACRGGSKNIQLVVPVSWTGKSEKFSNCDKLLRTERQWVILRIIM